MTYIEFLEEEVKELKTRVKFHDTGHIKTAIGILEKRIREIKRKAAGEKDWYDEYLIGF